MDILLTDLYLLFRFVQLSFGLLKGTLQLRLLLLQSLHLLTILREGKKGGEDNDNKKESTSPSQAPQKGRAIHNIMTKKQSINKSAYFAKHIFYIRFFSLHS